MPENAESSNLIRTLTFSSEGDNYQILIIAEESSYRLRVKKNGEMLRIGGMVEYDVAHDYERRFGQNACNMLAELIQKSIMDKTYEPK